MRRWLVLLGVLAVAASAVAAYALIQTDESADQERVNSLGRSLREANAQLERANRERDLEREGFGRSLPNPGSGGELAADLGEGALLVLVQGREGAAHPVRVTGEQPLDQVVAGRGEVDGCCPAVRD